MKNHWLIIWITCCLIYSISFAQYIGEVDTVGSTWYDYQHNGSCGRMIRVDSQDRIHVVWMNHFVSMSRHVYYNMRDSNGWIFGNTGISVESSIRAGYTCLALDSEDIPYPAFHVITTETNPDAEAACAVDVPYGPGFLYWLCPFIYCPERLELIWPKIAIDIDDRIHMINIENPLSGFPGYPHRIFYVGGEYDPVMMEINWDLTQQVIDWVSTISADITASRHSQRVAFVYADIRTTIYGDTTRYNNDIYLVVSEDGINWDLQNPINITNFVYPDTTLFPDTLAAMGDTLRAYMDASVFFDSDDNIHIAFTTPYYDEIRDTTSVNNSMIWHWCDATGYYSLIADGWFGDNTEFACGIYQRYVQRPCIAEDETTGDLYITYQMFDSSDIAANGYPQAEVMISRSTDNGVRWSVGTNVSNTHAPGGEWGYCYHEREITSNETVVNDTLHLFYILDKDAGSIPQGEGQWTLNPAICQRVPINGIPATPLVPNYPMHIDSTGFVPVIQNNQNPHIPYTFHLHQNYPNPFNPITTIQFDLNRTDHITLKIYNTLGREITTLVDARLNPGTYKVPFAADNLSSGIYFYKLESTTHTQTHKMVLLK